MTGAAAHLKGLRYRDLTQGGSMLTWKNASSSSSSLAGV